MRPKGSWNVGVRYVEGEWELRCNDCARKSVARYWPLTLEFWQPKWGMSRCRACWLERKAARNRERWASDQKFRAEKLEANRQHRRDMARILYKERWDKLRADPEKYAEYRAKRRELGRLASAKYRAKQREQVAA